MYVPRTRYFFCAIAHSFHLYGYIATATTVTKVDALASIKPYIKNALLSDRRVVLNDLGSSFISVRSNCFSQDAMAANDFSPSVQIKGYHINFRPEEELKKEIAQRIAFKRVTSET